MFERYQATCSPVCNAELRPKWQCAVVADPRCTKALNNAWHDVHALRGQLSGSSFAIYDTCVTGVLDSV